MIRNRELLILLHRKNRLFTLRYKHNYNKFSPTGFYFGNSARKHWTYCVCKKVKPYKAIYNVQHVAVAKMLSQPRPRFSVSSQHYTSTEIKINAKPPILCKEISLFLFIQLVIFHDELKWKCTNTMANLTKSNPLGKPLSGLRNSSQEKDRK